MKKIIKKLCSPLLLLSLFAFLLVPNFYQRAGLAVEVCSNKHGKCIGAGKAAPVNTSKSTPGASTPAPPSNDSCGGGTHDGVTYPTVYLSSNIGCQHKGNPIMDMTFAVIRILSDGVGLIIVASLTYAGVQYIGSQGDPQSTEAAVKRIRSNVLALFVFIFGYALLNYLIPGQVLK